MLKFKRVLYNVFACESTLHKMDHSHPKSTMWHPQGITQLTGQPVPE